MFNKLCLLFLTSCTPWVLDAGSFSEEKECVEITEVSSWLDKWAKSDEDVRMQFSLFEESLQKGLESKSLTESDVSMIRRAVSFAAEKHQSQFRKNDKKTPYIIHPIGVADHIMRIGDVYDVDVVIAALLHDVTDETGVTFEEIAAHFGLKVTGYIQEIIGDQTLSDKERQKRQIVEAPDSSAGASLIKMADKLHNLNTLMNNPSRGWTQGAIDSYFQWAEVVVDRLPSVNDSLKQAVHDTVTEYWERQSASRS